MTTKSMTTGGHYIDDPTVKEMFGDVIEAVAFNGATFTILLSVRRGYIDAEGDQRERRTVARIVIPSQTMQELFKQVDELGGMVALKSAKPATDTRQ